GIGWTSPPPVISCVWRETVRSGFSFSVILTLSAKWVFMLSRCRWLSRFWCRPSHERRNGSKRSRNLKRFGRSQISHGLRDFSKEGERLGRGLLLAVPPSESPPSSPLIVVPGS